MNSETVTYLKTTLTMTAVFVTGIILVNSVIHPLPVKEAEHDTYVPYNSDIYCQRGTGSFTIDSVTSTWFDASGLNIKTVSRQYKLPWYCVSMRPVTQPRTDGRN